MNILLLSAGRRTKLIKYFKDEFNSIGKIIAVDCSKYAPALYIADRGYLLPTINSNKYLAKLKEICINNEVNAILSLIDPELILLAKYKKELEAAINYSTVIVSNFDSVDICFDKFKMYKFLLDNDFSTPKTYNNLKNFLADYKNKNTINLPLFVKPIKGSASIDINVINDLDILSLLLKNNQDFLLQEYLQGEEFGVDVYVDLLSKEVVSIFIKYKIKMRSGETDQAISIKDERIFTLVIDLVKKLNLVGPIDIDIFKIDGEYYILEVNPRFGGGDLLAYECGENFLRMIKNNLNGIKNKINIGNYKEGICMMKHDDIMIKDFR